MACTLPTLDKTWEFHVNDTVNWTADKVTTRRYAMLALKNALINVTDFTSPWVVESCSDATSVVNNNPATADLWSVYTDINWEYNDDHSWIVLKQPGVNSGGFQICIDLIANSPYEGRSIALIISGSAGFGAANGGTDGTISTRPTATDERTLLSAGNGTNANWNSDGSSTGTILHVQISDDGECTRVQIAQAGGVRSFWIFDVAKDPLTGTPGWPEAIGGIAMYSTGSAPTYAEGNDTAQYRTLVNGNVVSAYITSIGDGSAASGQNQGVVNDLGGCWEMYECGIWAPDTQTPAAGQLGKFYDLRWVSTALSVGDTFPQSGGTLYQWMCIGDFAIPWNQINATYVTTT